MPQAIAHLALLVQDYDEAITFFVEKLGFDLLEDTPLGPEKRWVRVAPAGGKGASLLLARADSAQQREQIGNQSGGRVFLCWRAVFASWRHHAGKDMAPSPFSRISTAIAGI